VSTKTFRSLGLALLGALAIGSGCGGGKRPLTRPAAAVDAAVRPERLADALRKLGRAHYHGTATFTAGPDGTNPDGVTTDTDVWIDDRGSWRLVEINDKDGGREIVLHGRRLAVALRYGKMIRRPAEDPEPARLLEEGVGAPFAAWDLLRDVVTVDDFGDGNVGGRKVHTYKLTKTRRPVEPGALDPADRRSWRRTVVPEEVNGTVVVDDGTGLALMTDIKARYTMRRPGPGSGTPMHGTINVSTAVDAIGTSPVIVPPDSEDLVVRQRTVPEEKAMLGGLPRAPLVRRGGKP
jgi:hypothetical protein